MSLPRALLPLLVLLAPACALRDRSGATCEDLLRQRPADEVVAGVTSEQVGEVVAGVDGSVAFVWEDGLQTQATVHSIAVVLGSGRLSQRPDCHETCRTSVRLATRAGTGVWCSGSTACRTRSPA